MAVLFIVFSAALFGCAVVPPVKNEVLLLQPGASPANDPDKVRVVIFNTTNPVFSVSNSGKDVWLDGKGVIRLETGQFVELMVSKGVHTLKLLHQDVFDYYSTHTISVNDANFAVEICSTTFGNKARILSSLPNSFEESFSSVHKAAPGYWERRDRPYFRDLLAKGNGAFCNW